MKLEIGRADLARSGLNSGVDVNHLLAQFHNELANTPQLLDGSRELTVMVVADRLDLLIVCFYSRFKLDLEQVEELKFTKMIDNNLLLIIFIVNLCTY